MFALINQQNNVTQYILLKSYLFATLRLYQVKIETNPFTQKARGNPRKRQTSQDWHISSLALQNLKLYKERDFTGLSHYIDALNCTLLSQEFVLGTDPKVETDKSIYSKDWSMGDNPAMAQAQLTSQLVVTSSQLPPPTNPCCIDEETEKEDRK